MAEKESLRAFAEGIETLSKALCEMRGSTIDIESLEEMVGQALGESVNDYDLKMVRAAVSHPEAPLSFVFVVDWQGTATELMGVFADAVLRHEWAIYMGEVYNTHGNYDEPNWRYVGEPRLVRRFDDEQEALSLYGAITPDLQWLLETAGTRNGYLIELGVYSYSPDGSVYSSGLVDSKVYYKPGGKSGGKFDAA